MQVLPPEKAADIIRSKENLLLIDVRHPIFFSEQNISGSINIREAIPPAKQIPDMHEIEANISKEKDLRHLQDRYGKVAIIYDENSTNSSLASNGKEVSRWSIADQIMGALAKENLVELPVYLLQGGYANFYKKYPDLCWTKSNLKVEKDWVKGQRENWTLMYMKQEELVQLIREGDPVSYH